MGDASALIHRPTDEELHVDLLNGPGVFSRTRFEDYLGRHRRPGSGQRRLLELHPACRALPLTLDALMAAGLLHEVDEVEFELCGAVWERARAIGTLLEAWDGATPAARV
jgi:hypothetical protein